MGTFLKVIAIILIAFGAIITLAGIIGTIGNPSDITFSIIILLLFGVAPIAGGTMLLGYQRKKSEFSQPKSNKTKVELHQPKSNKTIRKKKYSEVEKLKILDAALGTGQIIRIKYHGGTTPGMVRDITPVYFNNDRPHLIDCYCTIAQDIRSFKIEKIEILEDNVQTDAHVPHVIAFTNE